MKSSKMGWWERGRRQEETLRTKATIYQVTTMLATIYQVTTMLATSKNVLLPDHNRLLITGTDDPTLYHLSTSKWRVISTAYRWLAGGHLKLHDYHKHAATIW